MGPKFLRPPLLPLHSTSPKFQVLLFPQNDVPDHDSQSFTICSLYFKYLSSLATLGKLLFISQGPSHMPLPLGALWIPLLLGNAPHSLLCAVASLTCMFG